MKNYIFISFLLLFVSCKRNKDESPFNCNSDLVAVTQNGVSYQYCPAVIWDKNDIGIVIERYVDGLWYQVITKIDEPYSIDSTYTLHSNFGADSTIKCSYMEMCCYYTPDQPNEVYYIDESDSINNFVQLKIDTLTHQASGVFKATFVNRVSPFDLIHFKCDTFSCEYIKEF